VLSSNNVTGTVTPNINLQEDIKPPKWVQWIADNKELIEAFGIAIGAAFGISTINKALNNIGLLFGKSGGMGLIGLKEMLGYLATGVVITLILKGTQDIINSLIKIEDEMDKLSEKGQEILDLTNKITNNEIPEEDVKTTIDNIIKEIDDLGISMEETEKKRKNLWYKPWEQDLLESQLGTMRTRVWEYIAALEQLYIQNEDDTEITNKFRQGLEKAIEILENAGINADTLKTKYKNLTGQTYEIKTKVTMDTKEAEKKSENLFGKLGNAISGLFTKKGLNNILGNIGIGGLFAKGGISYPRLASGGLVNYPGRGVMYGGANIGERGAEAILPLTDSQQMSLLGQEIGKNINLTATIPVYAYNRQVAREVRKIELEDNFARNGG